MSSSKCMMMGSWPVDLTNFRKSSGLKPMVAEFVIGWKYTFSWPPWSKAASSTSLTSPWSQKRASGVAQPWPTLSFSSMAFSSANLRFPLPTPSFLPSSFKLTCLLCRTVTSQNPFFFLSLRNRFLLWPPSMCCTWDIISSTVNTWKTAPVQCQTLYPIRLTVLCWQVSFVKYLENAECSNWPKSCTLLWRNFNRTQIKCDKLLPHTSRIISVSCVQHCLDLKAVLGALPFATPHSWNEWHGL